MSATAEKIEPTAVATPARSLVRKLAEVMGEVERIPKSGRNEFHRYDYATEADIVSAVRRGMAARHVMMFPSITNLEWREVPGKQGPQKVCTLHVEFTFIDGDTGEERSLMAIGEGQDQGDKATYKALTGATKYALMKTFLIPTGDDPEADGHPPARAPAKPSPVAAVPPPAPTTQTDRVKAAVKAKTAAEKPPANEFHAAIRSLFTEFGVTDAKLMASVITGATGKKVAAQLDEDDVSRVHDALIQRSKMEGV